MDKDGNPLNAQPKIVDLGNGTFWLTYPGMEQPITAEMYTAFLTGVTIHKGADGKLTAPVTKKTANQSFGSCKGIAQGYRLYAMDMRPSGESGVLNCQGGDTGGMMIGDYYYDVTSER